jgi:hypothetical protein
MELGREELFGEGHVIWHWRAHRNLVPLIAGIIRIVEHAAGKQGLDVARSSHPVFSLWESHIDMR